MRKKDGIVYDSALDAEDALNKHAARPVVIERPLPDGLFGRSVALQPDAVPPAGLGPR